MRSIYTDKKAPSEHTCFIKEVFFVSVRRCVGRKSGKRRKPVTKEQTPVQIYVRFCKEHSLVAKFVTPPSRLSGTVFFFWHIFIDQVYYARYKSLVKAHEANLANTSRTTVVDLSSRAMGSEQVAAIY